VSLKWIIFDAMGVIFTVGEDTQKLLIPYVQHKGCPLAEQAIKQVYLEACVGRLSSRQFWQVLGLGESYPAIEYEYLDNCLTLDPEFMSVARRLAERYYLAILSNDVKEWSAYLRRRFGLDEIVSVAVISGEVGWRKPGGEIYACLLEKLRALPEECVFIDDREANLRVPAGLGMTTIRFRREGEPTASGAGRMEITCFRQLGEALQTLNQAPE
jgi:HAD superfamily hydrolase (TIGR01509 family)